jgi:hypothetical protein
MKHFTKYYIIAATIAAPIINISLKAEWSIKNSFSWIYTRGETNTFSKKISVAPDCTFSITALDGDVTITGWNQPTIFIEAELSGKTEALKATTIDVTTSPQDFEKKISHKKSAETDDKRSLVTVTTTLSTDAETPATVNYTIMVPYYAQLKVDMRQGALTIKHVESPTRAFVQEGAIDLIIKQMTGESSFLLETNYGHVTLLAPRSLNAHLHARTLSGTVTSELPITTFPKTMLLNKETWHQMKKEAEGIFGDGEKNSPITLETAKGNIYIKEYK